MAVPLSLPQRGRLLAAAACLALGACAHSPSPPGPITLVATHSNPVAHWHDVGAATVNASAGASAGAAAAASEAERYAAFPADMATLQVAVYDAVMAIRPRYRPYLYAPPQPDPDASLDAAAGAAAVGVLRALFPSRAAHYEQAYQRTMAAIPEGAAKSRGLALGAAAAAAHLAKRATDGRAAQLPAYAAGDAPGRFRGVNPINRYWPAIRPFVLTSMSQFRPGPPPALNSAEYAADFNETRELGGAVSPRRSAEQTALARFHSEPPPGYFTRNFGRFARTTSDPVEAARLLGALYAGYADAIGACLEAKYHYDTWRPHSAIALAGSDGNPATTADPQWKPLLPTPNHPEYPAAHSCSAGFVGEVLRRHYRTEAVSYTWDSKVTGNARTMRHTGELADESRMARIYGGMHFRFATTAGAELGRQVGAWTMEHAFLPQPQQK